MSLDLGAVGAEVINWTGHIINLPFQGFFWAVDKVRDYPLERHRQYSADFPTFVNVAQSIFSAFAVYHQDMLSKTTEWSDDIRRATQRITKIPLYPITFSRIGVALRDAICEKLIGNIAKAISFIFLQFVHLVPYFFIGAIFTAVHIVYSASPVLFLTTLAGSILTIQILLIYRLIKTIELSNQILDEKLDQVNNVQVIMRKTGREAMKGLQWFVKMVFPKRVIPKAFDSPIIIDCESKGKKA